MLKYEDECCGCAVPGYPCIGESCKNRNVPRYYCDACGIAGDIYTVEDMDLCTEHLEEYLQDVFDELTIDEKAKALKIHPEKKQ